MVVLPRLSVSEITTKDWSFDEDVRGYLAAGLGGMGLWRDKLDRFGEERGIELLQETGLQVANVVDAGYFPRKTRSQTELQIQDTVRAIKLTSRLGCDCLLVVSGDVGSFFRTREEAVDIIVTALRRLAPIADEFGVNLALEPIHPMYVGYTFLRTIAQTRELLERVDHPRVGLFFDTYHLWQDQQLLTQIESVAGRIYGVHVSDWREPPRSSSDRALPGAGIMPLREILTAIARTGYAGFYDVELFSDELWLSDYPQLLQECKRRFGQLWE
jgi:sugar phosphate isomerase/epimerase